VRAGGALDAAIGRSAQAGNPLSSRTYLSIGDVLSMLRQEFPDVTISKIRFLESQGLVNPERSPSGYRKFYDHDVERLRWVLRQQREHFLPLKVIRDRLTSEDVTPGSVPPAAPDAAAVPVGEELSMAAGHNGAHDQGPDLRGAVGTVVAPVGVPQPEAQGGDIAAASVVLTEAVANDDRDLADARAAAIGIQAAEPPAAQPTPTAPPAVATHEGAAGPAQSAALALEPPLTARAPAQPAAPTTHRREAPASDGPADAQTSPHEPQAHEVDASGGPEGVRNEAARTAVRASHEGGGSEEGPGPSAGPPPGSRSAGRAQRQASRPAAAPAGASLTLEELAAASGLSPAELAVVERFGLIESQVVAGAVYYDEEALVVANLVAELGRFGVEPRHLRLYRNAVDREMALVEQVITPLLRQRNPEARQRAADTANDLARVGESLRAALVRRDLRRQLGG
jgi:DNA-binding transcriptional MerR regulator